MDLIMHKLLIILSKKAEVLKADPNANVSDYTDKISQLEANITSSKIDLKNAQDEVTKFNSLVAAFSGDDLKAYDAAIAELKTSAEALDKADKEYQAAMDAQDKVWIEYQIAYTLAGQNDVDELVEQCKYNIAQYEQQQLNIRIRLLIRRLLFRNMKMSLIL